MADQVKCPDCGEVMDARGANSHARQKHGKRNATKEDFQIMNDVPVTEATDEVELTEAVERNEDLVGVTDDAIIFRNEIIVTDPELKERIADALVDKMGPGGI
jgi:adenine-specific DNA methylase